MPGISKARAPASQKRQGFGQVKLGGVSSLASWKLIEGQIELTFNTENLSVDCMRDLEHYRSSRRPVDVQLPSEQQAVSCRVMGFERNANAASFYLTKVLG